MRVLFLGKYPPIQGGVSRINFWDAHALSEAGHDVHVVTNAPDVERDFRIRETELTAHAEPPTSGVSVHAPSPSTHRYIPYSDPFVSRLAGTAVRVADEVSPDLIYAYYLEPYGVAARLASAWTGVPFGLRHAGSDVGWLARHEALGVTYDRLARDAAFWLDTSAALRRAWQVRGVRPERFYSIGGYSLPTGYFNPDAKPLDLPVADPGAPTIGLYGKLGENKGTFDLLTAFASARRQAGGGNLVILSSGPSEVVAKVQEMAGELNTAVTVLPFMPHWAVPSFLAACDAVAYVERDFSTDLHRPTVPREVLACGRCLIISGQVAAYQEYSDLIRDGENCLVVDPRDRPSLGAAIGAVLESPERAREIGRRGYDQISRNIEDWLTYTTKLVGTFERIQSDIREERALMSTAEMQAAMARMSIDDAFRNWFSYAPDEALARYALDESERVALRSIDRKMLALYSESLRGGRRNMALEHFPLCGALHGEALTRYFDRYYDLHPAKPNDTNADLVVAFGRYLVDCIGAESSLADYAADLCRYELAVAELQFEPLGADEDPLGLREGRSDAPPPEPTAPVVATGVRCLWLSYDVPAIAEEIERGRRPESAEPANTQLVLRNLPGRRLPEVFKVGEAVATLLSLCDGRSGVEEIKRRVDRPGPSVDEALDRLQVMGLIRSEPQ